MAEVILDFGSLAGEEPEPSAYDRFVQAYELFQTGEVEGDEPNPIGYGLQGPALAAAREEMDFLNWRYQYGTDPLLLQGRTPEAYALLMKAKHGAEVRTIHIIEPVFRPARPD